MALPAFIGSIFPHMARLFAGNAAKAGATELPKMGLKGLLSSAYGGNAGLMNLGMDVIPLAMDIANNDVGLKSFSSFGGTMLGTKFGGRELNKVGESKLQNSRNTYTEFARSQPKSLRNEYVEDRLGTRKTQLMNDPSSSRQGYNMPIGFAADAGLYSLTAGMNKPKPSEFEAQMMAAQNPSPVTRYIQMTGGL